MAQELKTTEKEKFDKILLDSSVEKEVKAGKLTEAEKIKLKSYSIKKALKLKRYVRN